MDIRFAALAEYAAVDQQGRFNIIGLFSEMFLATVPANVASLHVALSFTVNPAEAGTQKALRVVLQDEDGKAMLNADSQLMAPAPQQGRPSLMNICLGIHNLAIPKEGSYQVSVLVNGETKAVLPFTVIRVHPPGGPVSS